MQVTETVAPAQVDASSLTPVVFMEASTALCNGLLFPQPYLEELATFIWSNFIITKLDNHQSYFLCRENHFHKFYHDKLVSFLQAHLTTASVSYSQIDNLIITVLNLLCFN